MLEFEQQKTIKELRRQIRVLNSRNKELKDSFNNFKLDIAKFQYQNKSPREATFLIQKWYEIFFIEMNREKLFEYIKNHK